MSGARPRLLTEAEIAAIFDEEAPGVKLAPGDSWMIAYTVRLLRDEPTALIYGPAMKGARSAAAALIKHLHTIRAEAEVQAEADKRAGRESAAEGIVRAQRELLAAAERYAEVGGAGRNPDWRGWWHQRARDLALCVRVELYRAGQPTGQHNEGDALIRIVARLLAAGGVPVSEWAVVDALKP
jgi:hypothetical protein